MTQQQIEAFAEWVILVCLVAPFLFLVWLALRLARLSSLDSD
jgi:hypothetical protein